MERGGQESPVSPAWNTAGVVKRSPVAAPGGGVEAMEQQSSSAPLEHLIMFAGPPCSGKSTVTERLQADGWSSACRALQIEPISSWGVVCDGRVPRSAQEARFIFHYDILRPRKHPKYRRFEEAAVSLLDRAGAITLVTFWADPERLRHRMKVRRDRLLRDFLKGNVRPWELIQKMHNNRTAARFFHNTSGLLKVYDVWMALSGRYPAQAHWFVDTSADTPSLSPMPQWPELRARLERAADGGTDAHVAKARPE